MLNISLRWWKTTEVHQMLKEQRLQTLKTLPHQPQSGQYFLIKPEKERVWKKDGYQYMPRSNGIGTREDVEKLKINGIPMIVCLYSKTLKSLDGTQLNRRIYKLLDCNDNIYLVHYLSTQIAEGIEQSEIPKNHEPILENNNIPLDQYDSWFAGDIFDSEVELKQKIQFLEQRIQCLEQERNTGASSTTHKDSQEEENLSFKDVLTVKIVDYSPEWDYTEGGTKMMLCYQPIREIFQCQILFGNIPVHANCVQPGVIKCIIPPNEEGKVELRILSNGITIDESIQINYFTYQKKRKGRREKQKKEKIMQNDEIDSAEFKVRVIEKLASFQNYFSASMNSCGIEQEQIQSLEQVDDYSVTQLISQIIQLTHSQSETLPNFFNEQDQYGFSLIHYLTLLGYQQAIKTIVKNGANINQPGCDGLTALQIAIILQQEEIVNLLIQLGAIDESFNDKEDQKQEIDKIFNLDSVYQNKKILDLLIRGYTLCDSIHNSSSYTEQQSWNEQDDQESLSYFQVNDLFENKISSIVKNEEKHPKHKYLRSYTKHENKPQPQEFSSTFPYDNYANHIQTIQKNVKAWLLRRQYLDIKYATQVLQHQTNCIKNRCIQIARARLRAQFETGQILRIEITRVIRFVDWNSMIMYSFYYTIQKYFESLSKDKFTQLIHDEKFNYYGVFIENTLVMVGWTFLELKFSRSGMCCCKLQFKIIDPNQPLEVIESSINQIIDSIELDNKQIYKLLIVLDDNLKGIKIKNNEFTISQQNMVLNI